MKNIAIIGWILVVAAFALYIYGAYHAIQISWMGKNPGSEPLTIEEGLDTAVSSINALLLANFGALLGISVAVPKSQLSKRLLFSTKAPDEIVPPLSKREQIQFFSVLIFLLVLIGCMVTFIHDKWSSKPNVILPFVCQSAKTFIAVLVAYLALLIGARSTSAAN